MIKPFKEDFPITQIFGVNPEDYAKFGLAGHNGLDYGLPLTTQVLAAISGNVIESLFDPQGYGNYIKVENDIEGCLVAHLERSLVGSGEHVQEGMVIGYSGTTGNSTGPHLHFGYYRLPRDRNNGFAGYTDPLPYLTESATLPPVSETPMNDQTIIDLGQYGKMEIQAIRGKMGDLVHLQEENPKLQEALKECQSRPPEVQITADLTQVSISALLVAIIKKYFK